MRVDLEKEIRRGRQASEELSLVREHIEERSVALFERFCNAADDVEAYELRMEAQALQRVQAFLEELISTGKLAEETS